MRIALDTNFLAYAEGMNGADRQEQALSVLQHLSDCDIVVPVQVVGELYTVLLKRAKLEKLEAKERVLSWCDTYELIDTSEETLLLALELSAEHNLQTWDAIIMSAAVRAHSRVLLTEDLQEGFSWAGLTIVNPFAKAINPLLAPYFAR